MFYLYIYINNFLEFQFFDKHLKYLFSYYWHIQFVQNIYYFILLIFKLRGLRIFPVIIITDIMTRIYVREGNKFFSNLISEYCEIIEEQILIVKIWNCVGKTNCKKNIKRLLKIKIVTKWKRRHQKSFLKFRIWFKV